MGIMTSMLIKLAKIALIVGAITGAGYLIDSEMLTQVGLGVLAALGSIAMIPVVVMFFVAWLKRHI